MRLLKLVCMLVSAAALLAGCGKSEAKPTYEGGHIALAYDIEKWNMSYQEAEPYPVFDLSLDGDEILIMIVENDGSLFDSFHNDIMGLYSSGGPVTEKGKTDEWDKHSYMYYEDIIDVEGEKQTVITYAKGQDNMLLIGMANVTFLESGEENTERMEEVLGIFSSMRYSEQSEMGELTQNEERGYITYIYDMLDMLLKYGAGSSDETVPDTEEAETADGEEPEAEEQASVEKMEPLSEEELAALQYVEKTSLEDYYGDKSKYDFFAPKETDVTDGFAFYSDHGLSFNAVVYCEGSTSYLYEYMDFSIEFALEDWQTEGSGYTDVEAYELRKNGEDRYQIITANREDYYGTPYEVKKIIYLYIPQEGAEGAGILWELEMGEMFTDDETDLIIDELAQCYCVNLDEIKAGGSWMEDDKERTMLEQDEYVPEEGDKVLEKIDGYQYLGTATLETEDGTECPVMVPMGWHTTVKDSSAHSSMHGVAVSGYIDILMQRNFVSTVKFYTDIRYDSALEDTERNRNVEASSIMYLQDYEEAAYTIVSYEEKDYVTEEYAPKIEVLCFIRIDDTHYLDYSITLNYDEYDGATNTVIRELETAYGIDLSAYYNENE